jgi:hypothetical protein
MCMYLATALSLAAPGVHVPAWHACSHGSLPHNFHVTMLSPSCRQPAPHKSHACLRGVSTCVCRRPLKLTGWELWLCGASNGPLFASDVNATAFDGEEVTPEVSAVSLLFVGQPACMLYRLEDSYCFARKVSCIACHAKPA